ncbi:unnamed protein product [Oncorhynchus mykiss]|uniref:Uncharacterized protein n=1 Tax=Oncorhynchus mykiss TaxID=8022 RepID=A0A060X160_ONCMY|nr:unnamed protein product [Oncorhynchus mykiss]
MLCLVFLTDKIENGGDVYQRRKGPHVDAGSSDSEGQEVGSRQQEGAGQTGSRWRRIILLIVAITIHNIPEPTTSQSVMLSPKPTPATSSPATSS